MPYFIFSRISSGFMRDQLDANRFVNTVQGGHPTRRNGFSRLSLSLALDLLRGFEKSHGSPSSGSTTVRSSANPGLRPILFATLVTLGGE